MTTTEKLGRYETAQETLGMLVAMRTRWIRDEELKAMPDMASIAQWEKEQTQFDDEDHALRLNDEDAINKVLTVYGPIVKARFVSK